MTGKRALAPLLRGASGARIRAGAKRRSRDVTPSLETLTWRCLATLGRLARALKARANAYAPARGARATKKHTSRTEGKRVGRTFHCTGPSLKSVQETTCRAAPRRSMLSRLRRLRPGHFSGQPVFVALSLKDNNKANEGTQHDTRRSIRTAPTQRVVQRANRAARTNTSDVTRRRRNNQSNANQNSSSARTCSGPISSPHTTIRLKHNDARLAKSRASRALHYT